MADETTTTTTTVADETTTTTTTEAPSTTTTTTEVETTTTTTQSQEDLDKADREARAEDAAAAKDAALNPTEVDTTPKPEYRMKQQSAEERGNDARQLALDNHAREHANDSESYESVTSRDKVEE